MQSERMALTVIFWTVSLFATPFLASSNRSTDGWVRKPGVVRICAGETAILAWEYDEGLGLPIGLNVARSDKVVTVLSKTGTEDPVNYDPKVAFYSNSGITITNVTSEDAGKYKSRVVFSSRTLQNEATLIVYDDCPDFTEFRNPQIFLSYNLSDHDSLSLLDTLADLGHLQFTVKVPEGKPKVNCTLQINGEIFDCESGATIDASTQFSFPITVTLHHEALGSHSRTILVSNATEESTTVSGSLEGPKASTDNSGFIAAVIVLAIFVLILLITINWMCFKWEPKKSQEGTVATYEHSL